MMEGRTSFTPPPLHVCVAVPRKKSRSGLSSLINLLLIGVVLLLGAFVFRQILMAPSGLTKTQGPNHRSAGQPLESFQVQPLTNVQQSFEASDLQGKVTLINFWGTWCPPCLIEMPHLIRIGRVYDENEEFQMVLISVGSDDLEDLRETTQSYLRKQGWSKQAIFHDITRTAQDQVATAADISVNFPTTVVVDQQGIIRGVWEAYFEGAPEQMEALVADLLAQP